MDLDEYVKKYIGAIRYPSKLNEIMARVGKDLLPDTEKMVTKALAIAKKANLAYEEAAKEEAAKE
jgi:hypothetical protein